MSIAETILKSNVKPRSPASIEAGAKKLGGADVDYLRAIVQVEAAGKGMDADGQIKVLFEKHKFYKNLPEEKRAAAVKRGLARKKWISPKNGGYKEQSTNDKALAILVAAIAFDEVAALKSASYGAGQVLGENYRMCGFSSVQSFVAAMCESEDAHIAAMVDFIISAKLDDEVRAKDTKGFTRGSNGKGQVAVYSGRIDAAFEALTHSKPTVTDPMRAAALRLGSTGYRVEALQRQLVEKGYPVKVDKDFGPATRRAVYALQGENGLKVDGIVGPETQAVLDRIPSVIGADRATATVAELKAEGDTVVTTSDNLAQGMKVGGGVLGAATIAEKTGALDAIADLGNKAETLKVAFSPFADLGALVVSYWYVVAAAACVGGYFLFKHMRDQQVAKHRAGLAV